MIDERSGRVPKTNRDTRERISQMGQQVEYSVGAPYPTALVPSRYDGNEGRKREQQSYAWSYQRSGGISTTSTEHDSPSFL